jgi:hypothetical protein
MTERNHLRLVVNNDTPLIGSKVIMTPLAEALDSQKRDQDIIKQTTENALDDTVKMLIMRTELWSDDVQEAWARHRGLDKDSDPDPAC